MQKKKKKKKKFLHEDVIQIRLCEKHPVLDYLNVNYNCRRKSVDLSVLYLLLCS